MCGSAGGASVCPPATPSIKTPPRKAPAFWESEDGSEGLHASDLVWRQGEFGVGKSIRILHLEFQPFCPSILETHFKTVKRSLSFGCWVDRPGVPAVGAEGALLTGRGWWPWASLLFFPYKIRMSLPERSLASAFFQLYFIFVGNFKKNVYALLFLLLYLPPLHHTWVRLVTSQWE